MAPSRSGSSSLDLADRLLDAQVQFHVRRLTGPEARGTVVAFAAELLDAAGQYQLADLLEPDAVADIVVRALATVPGSAAVSGFVAMASDVVRAGPAEPYPIGELADRAQVEAVLDALLELDPVLERALDRLTASPQVGAVASRFMGRIVGEVLAANKAVADRVPGLGSLMSFGTGAASLMMGAADKQLEGLLGDAVGKGGTLAVRRLNKILLETLRDPTTRDALLQVWDLVAAEEVVGLQERLEGSDPSALVDALHDLIVSVAATDQAADLGRAVVAAFFDRFGGYTPTELLDELDLSREDLLADLARIVPGVLEAMHESGALERLLRAQLKPFYDSDEVAALLA